MDTALALTRLSALANEHRLEIFRLLMHAGPKGLCASDIATRIGLSPSGLSFHIAQLNRAGLLRQWRRQRHIFYAVEVDNVRQFLNFLTQDCCEGNPELCGNLMTVPALCGTADEEKSSCR